jgi:hypothetical protein
MASGPSSGEAPGNSHLASARIGDREPRFWDAKVAIFYNRGTAALAACKGWESKPIALPQAPERARQKRVVGIFPVC